MPDFIPQRTISLSLRALCPDFVPQRTISLSLRAFKHKKPFRLNGMASVVQHYLFNSNASAVCLRVFFNKAVSSIKDSPYEGMISLILDSHLSIY